MHPALSVIFFTVTSGAGYGLFILLALAHVFGIGDPLTVGEFYTAGILSLVMITAGLLSSTFHLANPKNAWRAVMRFRTSWLSREGVFAIAFYPFAVLYMLGFYINGLELGVPCILFALIGALIALITVFTTGMIYGSLKTIPQWSTSLTPANYILLGLASGATFFTAIRALAGSEVGTIAALAVALVAIAAIGKVIYYFWIGRESITINTATGFTRAVVRLLDTGHTCDTFLNREFGHTIDCAKVGLLRGVVYLLAFALPIILLAMIATQNGGSGLALLAAISIYLGTGVERWLFFAEAKHVVNLYHGRQSC